VKQSFLKKGRKEVYFLGTNALLGPALWSGWVHVLSCDKFRGYTCLQVWINLENKWSFLYISICWVYC